MASNRYSKDGSYITAAAVTAAEGWLVLAMDELVAKDIANAGFFYLKDTLLTPSLMRRFRARFIGAVPVGGAQAIAVGEYGQCVTIGPGGAARDETITVNGVTPESRGPLRSGAVVQNQVVMVGMDRQVYRRESNGLWVTMETGLPTPAAAKTTGLEGVAGRSFDSLYAVGWDGEIWRFDGNVWHQVASPTNRILTAVCVDDEEGTAYACGRNGLVVRGAGDKWEFLDTGCPDDLWGIASFGGQVFAASLRRLYRLDGDQLELVEIDDCESFCTFSKCATALWSIGAKAVLSFDGAQWQQIA